MNARRFATALLTLVALNAQANDLDNMVIACPVTRLPSQVEVARVFDVHNFSKTYALRERVVTVARQQCMHGVQRVQIVSGPAQTPRLQSAIAGTQ